MENELVLLVTRLNSAGDGLFTQSQDTFVVEPLNWGSSSWSVGADASRATRITAALESISNHSQWYLVAVDKTVPGFVDIDETAQRFVYAPPPPVPPPPAQVTGVRVSPLDGGLRVTWSAAAGPVDVSQYRVDVADAAGERVRRVYTEADVFEAVVDGLANGVEYTVTVSAVPGHGGENGPPSEARTATPQADTDDPDPGSGTGALPSQVTGVRVSPLDGGLRVTWSAAAGPVDVSQYRVDVADDSGALVRRVHTEAGVLEAVVDGLVNGVEYTVTVSVLTADVEGPLSEPRTGTPRAGAGEPDPGGDTEEPVPALPLAGAGVLAGLLASAAYRFRRAGRRAHPGRRRSG